MIAVSVEKMRELEAYAIEQLNIPSILLMENAAQGFVQALKAQLGDISSKKIFVVCGKGNNGGDGYAIARLLHFAGAQVAIHSICDTNTLAGDAKINCDIVKNMSIPFVDTLDNYDIIVDAIFGTGFHGDVSEDIKPVIDYINNSISYVASVDIPSGLNADNGQGKTFVTADLCVTFGYAKTGLFLHPARTAYKKLVITPISIPEVCDDCYVITSDTFNEIPERNKNSHKGTFGKAMAFVGSQGMAGAAILSGSAILKSGAGMVTVATEDTIIPSLAHHFPSVMTYPVPTKSGKLCSDAAELILKKSKEMTAFLLGCGLGQSDATKKTVETLISNLGIPMVIDADGLNILSQNIDLLKKKKANIILTPHIAEFSRLSGLSISQIKENPIDAAKHFAHTYEVTVILKDSVTVISAPDGKTAICPAENSGMATAGCGDVLAGIVTSLLSQGIAPFDAARLGVYIHSAAGRISANESGEYGMTSEDVLNNVPLAFMSKTDIAPHIKEL